MDGTVAILPYARKLGFRPSTLALDDLIWPLGQPGHLKGASLGDLGRDDHLILHPRSWHYFRPGFGTRARVSILVAEPEAVHGDHLRRLRWAWRRFAHVLTSNEALLEAIPNGILFPPGDTWVPDWREIDLSKRYMCSLIASAKRSLEGHLLRHGIAEITQTEGLDVKLLGRGYRAFDAKSDGLAPYRYSVVIENVRERHYFTEKLIDAILCDTVPIYWGCPNIGDYFDTSPMIICTSGDDIRRALHSMSDVDYAGRLQGLRALKPKATEYGDQFGRAARAVLSRT